ncbi:unnamed protein product [Owenia fusiformis]|uniref:Septin-7 n=1 Tax=Owenia fusiformis TaxID=6347 RepID=A0A8J1URT1_OWEFU|nr:unnamed protein product [Owenia fusiformis]
MSTKDTSNNLIQAGVTANGTGTGSPLDKYRSKYRRNLNKDENGDNNGNLRETNGFSEHKGMDNRTDNKGYVSPRNSLYDKYASGSSKYVPLSERLAATASLHAQTANDKPVEVKEASSVSKTTQPAVSKAAPPVSKAAPPVSKAAPPVSNQQPPMSKPAQPPASLNTKRDAFFKNDPAPPKFEYSGIRERDKDRTERDKERELMLERAQERIKAPAPSLPNKESPTVDGYVGFANLPNQVYRKSVKKGFEFTLMVVGESGLGKSTLINSLFLTELYNSGDYPGPSHRIKKTVQVEKTQVLLKEGGVQLRLTVVDTPGFGDAVDNSNCWQPVIDFIDANYDEYLNSESRVNRKTNPDSRVHCCLYFIAPNGHGLKPLDVEFMKRLHDKVNIIPMIAKADTMTPDECRDFKKTILNEIAQHKIKIYEFPDCDDEEENKVQKRLKDRVPFAVVGSNTVVENSGKKFRGRVYPWGVVEVENLEHNDFIALRNMLIRTHMQDLKDVTNNVHYENFRYNKLASVSGKQKNSSGKNPLTQMDDEKKEHVQKLKKKEAEMEQVFEMKVKEKQQKLKNSENDLQRRAEQMKKSLEQQQKELDLKQEQFEKEKAQWEEQARQIEDQLRSQDKKKDKKKSLF